MNGILQGRTIIYFIISNYSIIGNNIQKIRESFGISTTDECRLWYWNNNSYVVLNDLEKTLLDATTIRDRHFAGNSGDKTIVNEKVII